MCVPVVIDNLDLAQIDPNDPAKRLDMGQPAGTPTGAAKAAPMQIADAPADDPNAPGPREDYWVNAGDWLRGNGVYAPSTAVGSPTGAPATLGDTKDPTPTGSDTPGGKPPPAVDPTVTAAQGPSADLMTAINQQAAGFSTVAQGILAGQQAAADALKSGFLDLTKQQQDALKAADELRKNTGQAERKPNYSLSASRLSSKARAGGIASTSLTGAGGVPVASLSLGRASLLGGAA